LTTSTMHNFQSGNLRIASGTEKTRTKQTRPTDTPGPHKTKTKQDRNTKTTIVAQFSENGPHCGPGSQAFWAHTRKTRNKTQNHKTKSQNKTEKLNTSWGNLDVDFRFQVHTVGKFQRDRATPVDPDRKPTRRNSENRIHNQASCRSTWTSAFGS
jgi:hypothetical protein